MVPRPSAGAAVSAAVVRDDPVALVHEEQHLRVPVVRTERPTVVKEDHLAVLRAPILVEDIDTVRGLDESAAHSVVSL